jgi:dihydrofolate reductase
MRNVIVFVNLTLDGYLAGPDGELDWMLSRPDEQLNPELTDAMRARVDTILSGRNFYHGMEENFRAQAADPASPPELVEFANWVIDTPKVVFSHTLSEVAENARVATDIPKEVAALKAEPGKDLVLFGGVRTVQQFARHNVVDEYWIKLYPVGLGKGQPLFTSPVDLTLIDGRTYDSGIITLRYRPS